MRYIFIIVVMAFAYGCGSRQKYRDMVDTAFELGACGERDNVYAQAKTLLEYYNTVNLYGTGRTIEAQKCEILKKTGRQRCVTCF